MVSLTDGTYKVRNKSGNWATVYNVGRSYGQVKIEVPGNVDLAPGDFFEVKSGRIRKAKE
ncbi:hypothetical protein HYS48_00475 [Candidatus Woesearchaeota archaeon]|nr:hypothetical protein [Candidatus Woesearchaeota archaeon]